MSDGGGFFTAEVTIKVAQAFVTHGGGDEASMVIAAHARGVDSIISPAPTGSGLGLLLAISPVYIITSISFLRWRIFLTV